MQCILGMQLIIWSVGLNAAYHSHTCNQRTWLPVDQVHYDKGYQRYDLRSRLKKAVVLPSYTDRWFRCATCGKLHRESAHGQEQNRQHQYQTPPPAGAMLVIDELPAPHRMEAIEQILATVQQELTKTKILAYGVEDNDSTGNPTWVRAERSHLRHFIGRLRNFFSTELLPAYRQSIDGRTAQLLTHELIGLYFDEEPQFSHQNWITFFRVILAGNNALKKLFIA